jgi:hypothetical protein
VLWRIVSGLKRRLSPGTGYGPSVRKPYRIGERRLMARILALARPSSARLCTSKLAGSNTTRCLLQLSLQLREAHRPPRYDPISRQVIARDNNVSSLADELGSSQSRVAKMEAADPSASLDLLVRALIASGVSRRALGGVISAA